MIKWYIVNLWYSQNDFIHRAALDFHSFVPVGFYIPIICSNRNSNCFNVYIRSDFGTSSKKFKKFSVFKNLPKFSLFEKIVLLRYVLKKSLILISWSLKHFFLTISQNPFRKKIPLLLLWSFSRASGINSLTKITQCYFLPKLSILLSDLLSNFYQIFIYHYIFFSLRCAQHSGRNYSRNTSCLPTVISWLILDNL